MFTTCQKILLASLRSIEAASRSARTKEASMDAVHRALLRADIPFVNAHTTARGVAPCCTLAAQHEYHATVVGLPHVYIGQLPE